MILNYEPTKQTGLDKTFRIQSQINVGPAYVIQNKSDLELKNKEGQPHFYFSYVYLNGIYKIANTKSFLRVCVRRERGAQGLLVIRRWDSHCNQSPFVAGETEAQRSEELAEGQMNVTEGFDVQSCPGRAAAGSRPTEGWLLVQAQLLASALAEGPELGGGS